MSFFASSAHDFRILVRSLSYHKECRFHTFLAEQVKKIGCVNGIGSIVERQGDAMCAINTRSVRYEPLVSWMKQQIDDQQCGSADADKDEIEKPVRINQDQRGADQEQR